MATAKGPLSIGSTISDSLQNSGEQDTFTVALIAGYNYQFTLTAAASFTTNPQNLYETLVGPNGVTVSNSQLSAGTNTSRSIALTPTTSGTYTLSIANTANATGGYLLAALPQDDIGTTPGTLAVGGVTSGTLESAGDIDTFTVALIAGYNYQFTLIPAASFTTNPQNLYETLVGPNGVTVSNSQLSAGSNTSKSIALTPTTSGTYTLSVNNNANATGAYLLEATPQDDIGTTPGTLAIGASTTGTLESAGDIDTFTVALIAGYNYQFTLTAAASFTTNPQNLYETLVGPNGVTVSNSQLSAGTNTSRSISLTPTTSGTYKLSVNNNANATGAYTLAATPQDDIGPTPGTLAIGGSTAGKLESAGDTDIYQINLTAGQNVKFAIAGAAGFTQASALDQSLISPTNIRVANPTSGSITYTALTTGTYTLAVNDPLGGIGTYTINASSVPGPVYRFFDNTNGTHFFTADVGERNNILAFQTSRYAEETNGFGDTTQSDPNETAVFRFFDNVYGTHFFTASADERNTIQATRSDLTYEPSSTFYEHATQQSGDVAVYRFFDTLYGTHFYTGDANEFAGLTNPGSSTYRSNLTYEGIGFYAPAGSFR